MSVKVFSTKALTGDTIFMFPTGDGTAILRGHPSHAKVQPLALYANGVSSFLSYFETLRIGLAPGIEPATFRSVKRSTNWANPATVKLRLENQ